MLRRPWFLVVVAWLAVAALTGLQNAVFLHGVGQAVPAWQLVWTSLVGCGLWALATPVVIAVTRRARWPRTAWLHVPGFVGVALGISAAQIAISLVLDQGLGLERLAWSVLGRSVSFDLPVYAAIALAAEAWRWAATSRRRAEQAARLEANLAHARLDALRGQLHPHFLFNTLHAVSSLVDTDPPAARRMIVRLGDLLRATLEVRGPAIALGEELVLIERYLDVQRVRFADRLTVTVDVPDDLRDAAVPPLLLQPLVENALRHGIGARPGPARIELAATREGDRLRVTVADDGVGPGAAVEDGIGMGVTRAALAALHGDAARLTLAARPGGGAVATVELPWTGAP